MVAGAHLATSSAGQGQGKTMTRCVASQASPYETRTLIVKQIGIF